MRYVSTAVVESNTALENSGAVVERERIAFVELGPFAVGCRGGGGLPMETQQEARFGAGFFILFFFVQAYKLSAYARK